MRIKRPLAPAFINRLDTYLLLHYPEIWTARTHLVLYYGFLALLTLAGIAFLVPDDPRQSTPVFYWIGFVSLISLVALIGWAIYLLRFNVFKRYGNTTAASRVTTFVFYFLAIGTFVLFCYVEPVVETIRANNAYTDKELAQDIDETNAAICRLEFDSLQHKWSSDTAVVVNSFVKNMDIEELEPVDVDSATGVVVGRHLKIDTAQLRERLASEDSVKKLSDSMYAFFKSPTYAFLDPYNTREMKTKPMTSKELYRNVIRNYTRPGNPQELRNRIYNIQKKYQWEVFTTSYYINRDNVLERIRDRYQVDATSISMTHILERKHRWTAETLAAAIRIFVYTTLLLSLLAFAFRHSTNKTFFLSILTAIVLIILTTLVMAFLSQSESGMYVWMLFYFLLFFGVSLTAFWAKTRHAITGIAITLFLWLLPFMPLIIVAKYYANRRSDPDYYLNNEAEYFEKYLHWAEWIGLLLLLVALGTYIHQVYRRWYAAPEN